MLTRRRLLPLALGSLTALLDAAILAQGGTGLKGVVLDKDAAPLPGVTVLATNTALGVSRGTLTDARGEFRLSPLPPGTGYALRVSLPGLGTIVLSDIRIEAGRIIQVPIILRPGSEVDEVIKVIDHVDVVDPGQISTRAVISGDFLDSLPIRGNDYQDALVTIAGVTDVDGDGNPSIHGSRPNDVITLVDGVSTVDPFTGLRGQELNADAIQGIEVTTAGATADMSRGQGGFVSVLTKSGGNEFEGSFKFYWQSNLMDGDGAGIDDPRLHGGLGEAGLRDLRFNDFVPFLSLSGPIKKDRAWYFLTGEYIQEQEPVNALTQAFVRTRKEKRIFGKVSWDVSTNHKLVFTAQLDPQSFYNQGLDSFTAVESGYTEELGGLNLVLKESAILSPNLFLETTVQHFGASPRTLPTLDPDTNGNGTLFEDRNGNDFIDATERDPGEDFDRDGAWDVFEDFLQHNGTLDDGEDLDGDGRLTPRGACEGATREDQDCNGLPDLLTEDRNFNQRIDDRPFPQADDVIFTYQPGSAGQVVLGQLPPAYPYEHLRPIGPDVDYQEDQRSLRISGPYFQTIDRRVGRVTLRADLSLYLPDRGGNHDLKLGGIVERETYEQDTSLRPTLLPNAQPTGSSQINPSIGVILPAENQVFNEASSTTLGIYFSDAFNPLPNLTIVMGLRFDREATDSFGYSPFDPVQERATFDKLNSLAGGERGKNDATIGNNDGIISNGFCSDPMFNANLTQGGNVCLNSGQGDPVLRQLGELSRIARSRLTQHHTGTVLAAEALLSLFPGAVVRDPVTGEPIIDRELLRTQGAATFQEREPFRLTNNNLAPRLGVSWDPFGDGKTKMFLSWGRYYDKLFLGVVTPEEGPDTIARYYNVDRDGVSGSGTPNHGIGGAITKAPPSATQVDRGLQTPFSDELTLGLERELAPEVSFKVTYINVKRRQQIQDTDVNHGLRCCEPGGGPLDQIGQLIPGPGGGNASASNRIRDFRPDLYIHNFFFNQIFRVANTNEARYRGIEVELSKRVGRRWQMDASYSYSRAVGDAEDFLSDLGDDPSSAAQEFGYLDFDMRHQVKFNAATFLPGDWQVGAALSWSSGLPYSVISEFLALDNFDYPQQRTLFGSVERLDPVDDPTNRGFEFVPQRRNSRRNRPVYNLDVECRKALVLGDMNARLFLTVENLLNTDDLRIFTYEPAAPNRQGNLQLDAERRFGRRFEVGFQFEF
jgi:hypothetical protein